MASRIVDERTPMTCKFGNLNFGDTFYDSQNEIYCMVVVESQFIDDEENKFNAIDLDDGTAYWYDLDEDVVEIKVVMRVVK